MQSSSCHKPGFSWNAHSIAIHQGLDQALQKPLHVPQEHNWAPSSSSWPTHPPSLVHTRWWDDAGFPTESVLSDNPLSTTRNPLKQAGSSPGTQTPAVAGEAGVFGGPIPNHLSLVGHLKSRLIQDSVVSTLQRGRHHPVCLDIGETPQLTAGNALTTGDNNWSAAYTTI